MLDYKQLSLEAHEKYHGKLEVISKIPLQNQFDLSVAYTPGVAAVCQAIAADPELVYSHTIKRNTVAVVTDGSAVLGLGNLGPVAALPVMEGKAILFKQFGGVDAFPVCLDTQDTEEIISTVKKIAPGFGGINLEDISAPRCFEIERRLRAELEIPVMHDDQHGTAVVVLAAMINALKLAKKEKHEAHIVINGAGAAGMAVAKLLLSYGFSKLILCDSQGTIYSGRPGLSAEKELIAEKTNQARLRGSLAGALQNAHVFIGLSRAGLLTVDMVRLMSHQPIIFAMANPIPEIMPDEAKDAGAFIVATGRSDLPNQINNVLAFPGIFRGALDNGVRQITQTMLLSAAQALAQVTKNLSPGHILPSPFEPDTCQAIARVIRDN